MTTRKPAAAAKNAAKVEDASKVEAPAVETPKASVASAFALSTFTDLPSRGSASESRAKYPFEQMSKGHMFFVPFENEDDKDMLPKRLSTASSQAGKSQGKKFAVRTIEEDGKQGVGVYCTASA